jgi:hypothetical protein
MMRQVRTATVRDTEILRWGKCHHLRAGKHIKLASSRTNSRNWQGWVCYGQNAISHTPNCVVELECVASCGAACLRQAGPSPRLCESDSQEHRQDCRYYIYFRGGAGTSGRRRGSPWKPRNSISSSSRDGVTTVLGMPPLAAPKAPSAVPANPPWVFCM